LEFVHEETWIEIEIEVVYDHVELSELLKPQGLPELEALLESGEVEVQPEAQQT
jgi:hypothetical protein